MMKFGVASNDVIIEPFIYPLKQNLVRSPLQLEYLREEDIFSGLLENRLQAGFITPLQYARSQDKLAIVEDLVIATRQYGRNCLLFFQEDLKQINRIYFPRAIQDSYELFLARLVLGEFFDIETEWTATHPFPPIEEALEKFPVLFLSGSEAFRGFSLVENYIDLTEEWSLKTRHSLVHRLLVIRRDQDARNLKETMQMALELGRRNLKKISQQLANQYELPWDLFHDLFTTRYQFIADEETWSSLREILQFAFYYGETEYYPEIHFSNV